MENNLLIEVDYKTNSLSNQTGNYGLFRVKQ